MKILKWFMQNFPDYVKLMRNCSYHQDNNVYLNLHHIEGDVWSHTVLSYNNAIKLNVSETVKWAILLHDIGRIFTRRNKNKELEANFGDFEGVSCFVALEILKKGNLSAREIDRILKIISYQYTIIDHIKYNDPFFDELLAKFKYEEELLNDLSYYVECDLFGRIIDDSRVYLYDEKRIKTLQEHVENIAVSKKEKSLKNNTLYLLVGPPCSRKSSWVAEQREDVIVVSRDSCIEEVGAKYGKVSYNEAHSLKSENKEINKEINLLDEERENFAKNSKNRDVIIDNPNLKFKNRKEQIEAFSKTHKIVVLLFLISFKELVKCDKKREESVGKSVSQKGIINKLKTFTYPLLSEGIDEILIMLND